jgi:mRNA interferase YafQ
MRTIKPTTRFRRDFKREKRGRYRDQVDGLLKAAVDLLADDKALPRNYADHSLSGKWNDCRDCHLLPDLVLIYRKAR